MPLWYVWRSTAACCCLHGLTRTRHALLASTVVGSHLWSGSDDKTIRVWDVTRANKCIGVLHGHEAGVVSLAHVTRDVWKPDEHDARARGTTPTGQQMFSPAGGSTSISGALSTAVVSGGMDGSIRIWHGTSYVCARARRVVRARAGLD